MRTAPEVHPPLAVRSPLRRHPLDLIVDRPRREAALAVAAAWIAFMAALVVGGEVVDAGSFLIGGVSGALIVWLGFAAASRCRTLPANANAARLVGLTLAVGVGVGLANLASNWAIAVVDPALRALLVERFTAVPRENALFVAPIAEEVAMRLFFLSAIAWVVSRFTKRAGLVFGIALGVSAVFFALLHLGRPFPEDPALANFYGAALIVKYTVVGLPFGFVFWRWGLPYAILCHAVTNLTHFALQGVFF
jgi:hypothetical protein